MTTQVIVGVDIGGTNIVVGTLTRDGEQISGVSQRATHAHAGVDAVIDRVASMVRSSIEKTREQHADIEVLGVGIGCPGPIDTKTGVVTESPNLRWKMVPLRDRIAEDLNLPATLDNDASCAILGEVWRGAGQGKKIVIGLTVGTGVGGGIVLDDRIFHGASDVASEFGHMSIDSTGRLCVCGNYGCLEAYASGGAIAARAAEGAQAGVETSLSEFVTEQEHTITAKLVYRAAQDGDDFALEVMRETARFLGTGVANIVNIFNPEMVILCGGVVAAGERLFKPIRQEVNRRAFKPASEVCQIVAGTLPGTAGVFGAAKVFRNRTLSE
jgi:glucokinase